MSTNGRRSLRRTGGLVAAALTLAACTAAQPADRAGGDTVVLRLATIDGEVNGNGQLTGPETFVEQLGEVSGGRLQIELVTDYGDGEADAESRLVAAIASGDLDGGWPSTRAFSEAGIPGLEAVEAPMTLTSSAAVAELVTGAAAEEALGLLDGSGVEGVALTAGPLRRPFAAGEPLLGPEDWAGQPFRVFNSPVQSDAIEALGGTPVNVGTTWVDDLMAGQLRGAEFDVAQYASNGLGTEAGAVTANVVLWPKVFVLALSEQSFGSLSDDQQQWVRDAAASATLASVDDAPADAARARELCGRGVRFVSADDDQLAALRAAVAPVVDGLADDPVTAQLMEQVQAIARTHPETEAVEVPADCRTPDGGSTDQPAVPAETSALPDGLYRVEISAADVADAGVDSGPGWSGTWTLEVADGEYVVTCRPVDEPGLDCGNTTYEGPLDAGQLRGSGQTVTFVWSGEKMAALTGCELPPSTTRPDACWPNPTYSLEWAVQGNELRFSPDGGIDPFSLTIEPYRKIA